jgi:hypothetical protein
MNHISIIYLLIFLKFLYQDLKGRQRFHNWDPKMHYHGPLNKILLLHDHHDKKIGKECCSLETVSFHYIKPSEMYTIYANKTFLKDLLS